MSDVNPTNSPPHISDVPDSDRSDEPQIMSDVNPTNSPPHISDVPDSDRSDESANYNSSSQSSLDLDSSSQSSVDLDSSSQSSVDLDSSSESSVDLDSSSQSSVDLDSDSQLSSNSDSDSQSSSDLDKSDEEESDNPEECAQNSKVSPPHGCYEDLSTKNGLGKVSSSSPITKPRHHSTACLQVTDLSRSEVMEKIVELMFQIAYSVEQGKGFSFIVPSRDSKHQYFEEGQMKLKEGKAVTKKFPRNARQTALLARILGIIYGLCRYNKIVTKRGLYYIDKELFVKQADSDLVIDDIACLLRCTRRSLCIEASERGLVVGDLVFTESKIETNCATVTRGVSIPAYADEVINISSRAKFILIVEKDAVLQTLANDGFYNDHPCIIITGKGQPDVSTRKFLKMLKEHLKIPVYALIDCNPYGLQILSTYTFGSKNMSYDSSNLITPDIHWLGLRPSDLDDYKIPNQCRLSMNKNDLKVAKDLLKHEPIKQNLDWVRELKIMVERKEKAEIQALNAFGIEYLASTYLPSKLRNLNWRNKRTNEHVDPVRVKRRRIIYDEATVLTNKEMKRYSDDPVDIVRKRITGKRESRLDVWKLQNAFKKKKVLLDPIFTGLCDDLCQLFSRITEELNDKSKVWKLTEISESSQCRALKLPKHMRAAKISRLIYTNSGNAILALASNAIHLLWKWQRNDHNASGKATAGISPQLWQPSSGTLMTNDVADMNPEESLSCLALSKNDSSVISASGGKISLFNMMTFKTLRTSMAPPPAATFLAFHPQDNDIIAIGMDDSTIQIYDVRVDEVKSKLKGHSEKVTGLAFSLVLNVLVSSGADSQICVWNSDGWEKQKAKYLQLPAGRKTAAPTGTQVQFHHDQIHFLVVHEAQLAIYEASTLECVKEWVRRESSAPILHATFSCDSQLVYACFLDATVCVFTASDLRLRCRINPSVYLSPTVLSNLFVYPMVIATHPQEPNQFALGLSDGVVNVFEPLESEGKWGVPPPPTDDGSTSNVAATSPAQGSGSQQGQR